MLTQLNLKTFKCFELLKLPLGQLTLLSGTNASGKSSVLQSLVLLNQTMRENEWSTRITASSRHCGLDPPVHRDENDEERSSSALQAHTLAQRDQRLVNPEVRGRANNKSKTTCRIPSPLMRQHQLTPGDRHTGFKAVSTKRCVASSQS